jgi:glycosyltransferase involved in cell wall biosynthesis
MSTAERQSAGASDSPLVSVIMIFLNEERFIDDAIRSVFAQSYRNWELLMVDDGSSDSSTDIARRYALEYPQKAYYLEHPSHENRGMSASRNLAIRYCRGEYLSFLDADDTWLPHKLEQQLAIIDAQPEAAMVCGRAQFWHSWTGKLEDSGRDFTQELDVELDTLIRPPKLLSLFLQNEWASICDILISRKTVEAVGGYDNSFRAMYEDQVFNAKVCLEFPVFVSSESWYRYRQHSKACTTLSNRAGQYRQKRGEFLGWLEEYLAKKGMIDTDVWGVLKAEQWRLKHLHLSNILRRLRHLSKQITSFRQSWRHACLV